MPVNQVAALYPFAQPCRPSAARLEEESAVAEREWRDRLGLPADLSGWILVAGSAGAVLLGLGLLLVGDPFGLLYLAAGVAAYLFLHARLFLVLVWSAVALGALAGAILGGRLSALIVVLAASGLALVAARQRTSQPAMVSEGSALAGGGDPKVEGPEEPGSPLGPLAKSPEVESRATVVRSIGRLQLIQAGEDLSGALLQRPTLAFLWSFLLARSVLTDQPLLRNSLADELSPGLPAQIQTKRLRDQIYNLQHDLSPVIGGLIESDRKQVRLCLNGADFDAFRLRGMSQSMGREGELLDQSIAEEADKLLQELANGEFLPGFEELENAVTEGRGAASQIVRDARLQVAGWRAAVACAVADHRLARRQPELALRVLEPALADAPEREEVGRRLIATYLQTGQTARAEQLRRQLGTREEV